MVTLARSRLKTALFYQCASPRKELADLQQISTVEHEGYHPNNPKSNLQIFLFYFRIISCYLSQFGR